MAEAPFRGPEQIFIKVFKKYQGNPRERTSNQDNTEPHMGSRERPIKSGQLQTTYGLLKATYSRFNQDNLKPHMGPEALPYLGKPF